MRNSLDGKWKHKNVFALTIFDAVKLLRNWIKIAQWFQHYKDNQLRRVWEIGKQ